MRATFQLSRPKLTRVLLQCAQTQLAPKQVWPVQVRGHLIPIGRNADDTADVTTVNDVGTLVAHGTAGYVTGGRLRQKDGSGTMMVAPMYVQHDSNKAIKEFTLTYTAATYIQNAVLKITVPDELLGPAVDGNADTIPLQSTNGILAKGGTDDRKSGEAGYVDTIDRHADPDPPETDYLTVDNNTITWHNVDMNKGNTFRTRIKVDTSGTAINNPGNEDHGNIIDGVYATSDGGRDDVDGDGVYPFYTEIQANSASVLLDQSDERTSAMLTSTLSEVKMLMLHLRSIPTRLMTIDSRRNDVQSCYVRGGREGATNNIPVSRREHRN